MTMRASGANAARSNAGVCSGKHGQRRLLLWSAAAVGGRRWLPAALVCGSRCPGIPRAVCFLLLSRSGARNSRGTWSGGVARRRPRGGRHGGRECRKAGKASEHFFGGVERAREPGAGRRNNHEGGISAREIPGRTEGTGARGNRAKR